MPELPDHHRVIVTWDPPPDLLWPEPPLVRTINPLGVVRDLPEDPLDGYRPRDGYGNIERPLSY
jgi:hypothetical protein